MICNIYKSVLEILVHMPLKIVSKLNKNSMFLGHRIKSPFGTVPKANSTFGVERKLEKFRVDKMFQFKHLKETRQTIEHLFNVITLGNTTS